MILQSGGGACYSNTTTLTTGSFGEWRTEQSGVNSACDNASQSYFLNININGVDQTPRRRLVVFEFLRKDVPEITISSFEADIIKVRTGLKDLNKAIWQSKLNYAREFANTTLFSQREVALELITTTTTTTGESIEFKIIKLQQASEQAKVMINSEFEIAQAKILEAKKVALLNGEKPEDLAEIEAEANLHLIALNLTAQEQINIIEQTLNDSITEVINSDDGIRFCLSNGTNCMGSSSANLTNYALKNQSETFAGNITTTQTGFFGWLGSLTSRITKLWVQDIDVSGTLNVSGNLTGITKEVFYSVETSGNIGTFRTRSVGATGNQNFNVVVPDDFVSLVSVEAIVIVSGAGAPGAGKDIDLNSNCGNVGEAYNANSESDTTSTYTIPAQNVVWEMNVSSVFSGISAGDYCGINIDHNGIGGSIDYLGIKLRYKT